VNVDIPRRAPQPRRRDAAATRHALLVAAREQIAEHGFSGTSTRDVAAAAGVNQALVYRYFGSKEKLFAEAVGADAPADVMPASTIAGAPLADLPRILLEQALDMHASAGDRASSLATLVFGANDAALRALIRERIEAGFSARLAERLDGPDAALRAELLAALITGITVLREKVGTRALSEADRQAVGTWVELMAAPLLAVDRESAG
jgi:AcrR family transcriptional regulator